MSSPKGRWPRAAGRRANGKTTRSGEHGKPPFRLTRFSDTVSFGHASTLSGSGRSFAARVRPSRRATRTPRCRFSPAPSSPTVRWTSTTSRASGTSRPCSPCSSISAPTVEWTGTESGARGCAAARPKPLDPKLCSRIRASILLAGPMLARFGAVTLPPPGGDVIGRRRVDTHFLALEQLGASVESATATSSRRRRDSSAATSSSTSRASPAPRTR